MNMYTTQKEEPYIGITWRVSRKEKDKHNFDSIQYLDQYKLHSCERECEVFQILKFNS